MLFINWLLGTNESSGVDVTQVEQQTAGILWNGHPYDVNIMIMNLDRPHAGCPAFAWRGCSNQSHHVYFIDKQRVTYPTYFDITRTSQEHYKVC